MYISVFRRGVNLPIVGVSMLQVNQGPHSDSSTESTDLSFLSLIVACDERGDRFGRVPGHLIHTTASTASTHPKVSS